MAYKRYFSFIYS